MKIAIGSDHAGFPIKEVIREHLEGLGHMVADHGTYSTDSVDYPDFAHKVAHSVATQEVALGVVVCGSGNGVAIAANRHPSVRAALAWLPELATLARQHNDANVLSVPGRYVTPHQALVIVDAFLNASFEGGRHQKRVEKIDSFRGEE